MPETSSAASLSVPWMTLLATNSRQSSASGERGSGGRGGGKCSSKPRGTFGWASSLSVDRPALE